MRANSSTWSWLWMMPMQDGPTRIPAARKAMMRGWRSLWPTAPMNAARARIAAISRKLLMLLTSNPWDTAR